MNRPNPDALLKKVQAEEPSSRAARLKVFFGMAPGVGKTYAMLSEARERLAAGVDVVAGVIETHGRAQTQAMLEGFRVLDPREETHNNVTLREFDLDAALKLRPQLILVDELAHTNAPNSRHAKRWQDVEELLGAGIDVYTTVNVQHLESLNDVVAQITGVIVRETVPDRLLERADEIELIDLSPHELQQRLKEGRVYVPHSAERALSNFFREGNLTALRELALRRTAECVDAQMQLYRRDHDVTGTWPATERILVCIGPHPLGARLVRAARRMATSLHAQWIVAWVETSAPLSDAAKQSVQSTLRLAESLGAEMVELSGSDVADALLVFARERNVSKIVVGKPVKARWRERLFGSVVDDIVRNSGDIDVYVITGEKSSSGKTKPAHDTSSTRIAWPRYFGALGIVAVCTGAAWAMHEHFAPANLTMIYLLGVVLAATTLGRGPSVVASLAGVAVFDYLFVPPFFNFAVSDVEYLLTFVVMLGTGFIVSNLTSRVHSAAQSAREREKRTLALYSLARDLAATRGSENIVQIALRHIEELTDTPAAIWRLDGEELRPEFANFPRAEARGNDISSSRTNNLPSARTVNSAASFKARPTRTSTPNFTPDAKEAGVARWSFDHAQTAGAGTDTLPAARAIYLPLKGAQETEGVLSVSLRPENDSSTRLSPLAPSRLHDLETLASQVALALERARLADAAHLAQVQIETERLRNSLLSAVSHDLRTPLASIVGASSSLLEDGAALSQSTRNDLLHSITDEANRLHRLVSNLLEMTRLQSGAVEIKRELQPLEEVVGAVLARFEKDFGARKVTTNLPADLPQVPIDATLMEQVFINLVENALKYSPPTGSLHIAALRGEGALLVEISDRGIGVPVGQENEIFNPFFRAVQAHGGHADSSSSTQSGAGLGLAICRAIVEAHGGKIWAENRPRGGAVFRFTLPLGE